MKRPIAVSEAESAVMEALWQASPAATEDVLVALSKSHDWHESTVKTLLARLVKKGAIRATRDGRRYLYSPLLTRDQWVASESETLLNRLFGGKVAPLVAHFSKRRKLSRSDVAELKRLIQELDHD